MAVWRAEIVTAAGQLGKLHIIEQILNIISISDHKS